MDENDEPLVSLFKRHYTPDPASDGGAVFDQALGRRLSARRRRRVGFAGLMVLCAALSGFYLGVGGERSRVTPASSVAVVVDSSSSDAWLDDLEGIVAASDELAIPADDLWGTSNDGDDNVDQALFGLESVMGFEDEALFESSLSSEYVALSQMIDLIKTQETL